jgi:hypothetical protein
MNKRNKNSRQPQERCISYCFNLLPFLYCCYNHYYYCRPVVVVVSRNSIHIDNDMPLIEVESDPIMVINGFESVVVVVVVVILSNAFSVI